MSDPCSLSSHSSGARGHGRPGAARGMGRLVPALALLILAFTGSRAGAATARTCHWWHDLSVLGDNGYARAFKLGYVAGFAQGAYLFIADARGEETRVKAAIATGPPRAVRQRVARVMADTEDGRAALDLAGFTTDQLVEGLDRLCADGENEDVDVHEGLKIVRWRLDGRPPVEIARELERMRVSAPPAR